MRAMDVRGLVAAWVFAGPVMALLAGCVTLPEAPRTVTAAYGQPLRSPLGRAYATWTAADGQHAGVRLLARGDEAFALRAASAELAQRTLDLQYYIVADDASATLLLARALRAADRGVRVRLLVDDLGTADADGVLESLDAHPDIEVRLYNPFSTRGGGWIGRALEYLGNAERLGQRMHHKLWVVDNALAIVGGRNLGNAYFAFEREREFADLDALLVGPLVRQLSQGFDDYWNSEAARPLRRDRAPGLEAARLAAVRQAMQSREQRFRETAYAQALRAADLGPALRGGRLELVGATGSLAGHRPLPAAPPDAADATPIVTLLRAVASTAQRELLLVSPYFVPSDRGVEGLCALQQRGVRVRVLTNSLASTDVPIVHAGYARKRPALLRCGVELYELKPGPKADPDEPEPGRRAGRRGLSSGASLHAKAVLADRRVAILGSMNLDPRSRRLNTEIALRLDSSELGAQLGDLFDEAVRPQNVYRPVLDAGPEDPRVRWLSNDGGAAVCHEHEPEASLWRHLASKLLGALAPEDLL